MEFFFLISGKEKPSDSVADPHHFDPDPACHLDVDPDPAPSF
jgi:hypothetical protein